MTQHPYADILRAIADGLTVDRKNATPGWSEENSDAILHDIANGTALAPGSYRIKPHTVLVNGKEVPAPLSATPADGAMVWHATVCVNGHHWRGYDVQLRQLAGGELFATDEACREHAQARMG